MKSLAGDPLQTIEVDLVPAVESNVTLGKIVPDDSDQFDRGKKAGGYGGMTGRAAEQARIFAFWGLD